MSGEWAKPPVLLLLIAAFYVVAGLAGLAFCAISFTAAELPPGYILAVAVTALLTLVAAIAFLFVRRQAFHLFGLALAASLIMYAWPFVDRSEFQGPWYNRMVSAVVGFGLMIAVVLYCRTLKDSGVLK